MPRLAAAAFLFLLSAAAAFAVPEVDGASQHNLAMAGRLISGANYCGFAEKSFTLDDMFTSSGIKAVSMIPQVNGTTSDRSSPALLWSLTALYPDSHTFDYTNPKECAGTIHALTSPTNARFSGTLDYSYGSYSGSAPLSLAGPNPVPLVLRPDALQQPDLETLFVNLSVKLSGTFSIDYTYVKTTLVLLCSPACSCFRFSVTQTKTYQTQVDDSRTFFVESGPVETFWVNPPLYSRLDGNERSQLGFFARRMPANVSVQVDGKEIAEGGPYRYAVRAGSCGEEIVDSSFSPSGVNMALNMSNGTVFPFQLVDKNASYLPFYSEFWWNETAGRKALAVFFTDRFNGSDNFSRNYSVRKPEPFSGNGAPAGGGLAIRQASEKATPASYPVAQGPQPLPSYSALAILFALPFALGAIAIIRSIARLHGKS